MLPPGRDLDNGPDLFVGEALTTALTSAQNRCDVVLVAGGSMDDSHAQALATCVDAVVFEVEAGVATRSDLSNASNATELFGSGLLGAVFISHAPSRFRRPSAPGQRLASRRQRSADGPEDPDPDAGADALEPDGVAPVDDDDEPAVPRPARGQWNRPWPFGRERRWAAVEHATGHEDADRSVTSVEWRRCGHARGRSAAGPAGTLIQIVFWEGMAGRHGESGL